MKDRDIKLFIDTLGCPKNFNDSEAAAGIWKAAGMTVTKDPAQADAIMVNTCGFINDAKRESIDRIFEMIRLADACQEAGRTRPLVCVSGCLSQRYAPDLAEEIPEVDVFLGVNEYEDLPRILGQKLDPERWGRDRIWCSQADGVFREFSARDPGENPYTATLRIAEGCNNRCAYCVIPQIRGGYRSRRMEDILSEARVLAAAGCRELILIAQDVTEYGRDLYGDLRLPQLLQKLCGVEGIRWIRLMYCYEDKITDDLIRVMAQEPKICHYIDIPLQHCSDQVLQRMRRRSTNASIRDTIGRLRQAIPDIHIRTTFITGFPGESREDFEDLVAFAEETRFERLGVFAYSREEGTPAGDMPDQIEEEVKAARADEIMRHQVDISLEVGRAKVGTVQTVLVEGPDTEDPDAGRAGTEENRTEDPGAVRAGEKGADQVSDQISPDIKGSETAWLGRTQYDAPEIDGSVIFTSDRELQAGDMVRVRITDAFDYDLVGEMIEWVE